MACGVPFSAPIQKGANAGAPAPVWRSCLIWLIFVAKLYCGAFLTLGSDYLEVNDILNARSEWEKESPSADFHEFPRETDWKLAEKLDPGTEAFRRCCEENWIGEEECPTPREFPKSSSESSESSSESSESSDSEEEPMEEEITAAETRKTPSAKDYLDANPTYECPGRRIVGVNPQFDDVMTYIADSINWEKARKGLPIHKAIDMEDAALRFKHGYNYGIIVFPMELAPIHLEAEKKGEALKEKGLRSPDDDYKGWLTFYISMEGRDIINIKMTFCPTPKESSKETSWRLSGTYKYFFFAMTKLKPLKYSAHFTDKQSAQTWAMRRSYLKDAMLGTDSWTADYSEYLEFEAEEGMSSHIASTKKFSLHSHETLGNDKPRKSYTWTERQKSFEPETHEFDEEVSIIKEDGRIEKRSMHIKETIFLNRSRDCVKNEKTFVSGDGKTLRVVGEEIACRSCNANDNWGGLVLSEPVGGKGSKKEKVFLLAGTKNKDERKVPFPILKCCWVSQKERYAIGRTGDDQLTVSSSSNEYSHTTEDPELTTPWDDHHLTDTSPSGLLARTLYNKPHEWEVIKETEPGQEEDTSMMAGNDEQPNGGSPTASKQLTYSAVFLVAMIAAFAAALLERPQKKLSAK